MKKSSCIIVGAGPAGLSAAIAAARAGWSVVVLEKNPQPGRKLLLAGGGRANLFDPEASAVEALEAYGRSGRFLRQALAALNPAEFLKNLDIRIEREEEGIRSGSIYVRGGARRLLEALVKEATRLGVEFVPVATVTSAARLADGTFEVKTARQSRKCTRLIIATGGMTYPVTGSSGDGYRLAEMFGHKVESPRPALGALVTEPHFTNLAGVSVADASVTARRDGRKAATKRGGLLFTHEGISGPAVLDLSLELARATASPQDFVGTQLLADLWPEMTREQIDGGLLELSRTNPKRTMEKLGASTPLSSRLVTELARLAGIEATREIGQVLRKERVALVENIKAQSMIIKKPLDVNEAIVTVGGVVTEGLDPHTMESRTVPGLCFAGELLTPAGPCGGYNLLMAFATGQAAGSRGSD